MKSDVEEIVGYQQSVMIKPNSCGLDKCNWSRAKNMCEVPGEKYYSSDNDNLIYRNNILFSNIDEEEGNYKIVRKPTKFKDAIQMYRFKGL